MDAAACAALGALPGALLTLAQPLFSLSAAAGREANGQPRNRGACTERRAMASPSQLPLR